MEWLLYVYQEITKHIPNTFWFCLVIFIYLIGFITEISVCTIKDVKHHDGGFLNMGYSTYNNKELTSKDTWLSLVWPIRFIFYFFKTTIWLINEDIINIALLIFGCKYKNTKIYKIIKTKTN